ncbi:hypothetical protein KP509_02G084400 [Ceratopteris richardii]|uniref:TF-B3 domain-containing protein n=1 Tax=Ceratopteris richardii TaxID=49495 RepID=A0A8T2V7V8_CERRI|nr:hypothetical protein KP509_02G084400 [Ceratopteris richardii]
MAPTTSSSYEDAREQRLADNKRRLEELGLGVMCRSISDIFKKTKTFSPQTRALPRKKSLFPSELFESRRSPRIAQKPAPVYHSINDDPPELARRRSARSSSVRRRWCSYISDQARDDAADAASRIEVNHPSFVKRMLPSHVSSCFWLGLPLSYCKAHLPKNDQYMKLVNEEGEEWESLYLARKTGLSAGWKRFAEDNELRDGDAVLFELVQYNQFNVRIVRVDGYEVARDDDDGDMDDDDDDDDTEESL